MRQSWASNYYERTVAAIKNVAAYGIVSVLSLTLELATLHWLLSLRVMQPIAVSSAFMFASVFQFCVLRYVVFQVTHRSVAIQINAYIISLVISWLTVLATVSLLTALLRLPTMLAREITIPLLFPLNYLLNRHFIFRR